MINFIREKKQCLFARLCNGVHINLRKILCGISVASQESSCRSQDGARPTGEGGWRGRSLPSPGGQPSQSYSSTAVRARPMRGVPPWLLLLLLFVKEIFIASFPQILFSLLSSLVKYVITRYDNGGVHWPFRLSVKQRSRGWKVKKWGYRWLSSHTTSGRQ